MKKLLTICYLLFILLGCESKLNTSLYVSSIGFEFQKEQLTMYFLCNPLSDISRSENNDLQAEYFTIEANSITGGIEKVQQTIPFNVNFMHLQTVVFHKDFLASDKLPMFLQFMQDSRILTYNFYCFATEKPIKDIFEYESPNTISFQHSLLASPSSVDYSEYGTERMHFLTMANDYYEKNRYLHLPLIDVKDTLNDKSILTISGFASISDKINFYHLEDYYAMHFLYEHDFIFYENKDKTYELRNFRFYFDVVDKKFTFTIRFTPLNASNKEKNALKDSMETEFRRFFDDYIQNESELYFIKNYNYLNKKALNAQKYQIIILIW